MSTPEPPATPPPSEPPPSGPPPSEPPPPSTPPPPSEPPSSSTPAVPPAGTPSNLADWGTRALGLLIDWLPALILSALTYRASYFFSVLGYLYWGYLGHLEGVTGQTPGKAIQGTRLVNENGELMGSGAGIGRKFLHILDFICFIGFLLPLVDSKRQTFADKIMNSYVVTGVEKRSFNIDLWMPPKG